MHATNPEYILVVCCSENAFLFLSLERFCCKYDASLDNYLSYVHSLGMTFPSDGGIIFIRLENKREIKSKYSIP